MWNYSSLSWGKAFQVLIWREGDPQHNGAAEFTRQQQQRIDLDEVSYIKTRGVGAYYWSVVVVDQESERRLSPEATSRRFTYTGPQQTGDGSGKSPGETPEPTTRP
jgi:hypothetical protein